MALTPSQIGSEICASGDCNVATLTFMAFLSNYIGFSYDNSFRYINTDDAADNFDFVIVGGGSAGCVVANRLSENPNWKVCTRCYLFMIILFFSILISCN